MAYRFYIFKERITITLLKFLCLSLFGFTTYIIYTKQTKYYLALIIANLVLITLNFIIPKVTSINVQNALKIKGNFILDSNNNGYMVSTFYDTFTRTIIMMIIITLLIYLVPIGLKDKLNSLNKYEGFSYLFLFIIFYNLLIINSFISNFNLKRKQNKIFATLQNQELTSNIKEIKNIVINDNRIYGSFFNQETELLFNISSSEYKNLISSIIRNSENNTDSNDISTQERYNDDTQDSF